MLLLIDNYDSFTHNVAQYFRELEQTVRVVANDGISLAEIEDLAPAHLVISPGPCTPRESGVSMDVIRAFKGRIPLLGVCLGHQCIAEVLGAKVVPTPEVVHGKTSAIYHNGRGVFEGLPNPFRATRYHSLSVDAASLPEGLTMHAWTEETSGAHTIMGLRHAPLLLEGVQFHPESILTEHGHRLFENFLRLRP